MTASAEATAEGDPFCASGPVPHGAFYIERAIDAEYVEQLADAKAIPIHLHGSRQSGKTSLLIRARRTLEQRGYAVALLDLSSLTDPRRTTAVELCQNIAGELALKLGLDAERAALRAQSSLASALTQLGRDAAKPTILIFDELDVLPGVLRAELHRTLRALNHATRTDELSPTMKISLCGVEPPLGYFDLASPPNAVETVLGEQVWLDDIPLTDAVATRLRSAFPAHLELPIEAARVILKFAGGYPQACSWLGNLVARERIRFDAAFEQRLEQRVAEIFDAARNESRPRAERRRIESSTAWVHVIEGFFVEKSAGARAALDVFERVLTAFEERSSPVQYEHGDPAHELLRTSGLARHSHDDGRLRLRCPMFRESFGRAWLARVARRFPAVRGGGRATPIDKRLLVIGTGGTIGMAENRTGIIGPGESGPPEWFRAIDALVAHVEILPLLDLDSADVGPQEWTTIVDAILQRQTQFDGVVVAHGTDTMAYTASAVAFALGRQLGFPVVFTGSQATVDVPHGDALQNMLRAALVATHDLPEVVVMFGERIFRATRTQKKDDRRFDAFESPGYPELGFVAEEVQIFPASLLSKTPSPLGNLPRRFESGILHVALNPGSEAGFYEAALDAKHPDGRDLCRAIVIQSLGAGNIPTKHFAFNLTRLIRAANERNVPVILTGQYPVLPANYLRYSPSQAALKAGAIPTGNMTIAAVVAKLSWVLPQVDEAVRQGMLEASASVARVSEMMRREYVGEGGLTIVEGDRNENGDAGRGHEPG